MKMEEYYKRHHLADLCLDTLGYNSHATAVDCLWSGLPLITKIGKGFQARVAASLLTALGMEELITESNLEYKNLILKLAKDPIYISNLKNKLKKNLTEKPLFNTLKYIRNFEDALTKVYFDLKQ